MRSLFCAASERTVQTGRTPRGLAMYCPYLVCVLILTGVVAAKEKPPKDERVWKLAVEYARRHPNPHAGTDYVDPEYGDLPDGDIIVGPEEEWPPRKIRLNH